MEHNVTNADGSQSQGAAGRPVIETITQDKTLTTADSGKTFILKAAAGKNITLPAVTAGIWKFKFITGLAFSSTAWVISSTTAVIQGGVIVNSTFVAAGNENTITFSASAESLGDWVEVESDGTNIYVNGVAASAGAVTLTAV